MGISHEHTITTPGYYYRLDHVPSPEQLVSAEEALGQLGMTGTFIQIDRDPTELLPFDSEEIGVELGEMSKEDFIALNIQINPKTRNTPNRTYNVLLRNQRIARGDNTPLVNPQTGAVDLDALYQYARNGSRSLIGAGETFQHTITQILNHHITALQENS